MSNKDNNSKNSVEDICRLLQSCLAEELLERIKSGEAKAQDLNVARQFLKDNGIEQLPVEGTAMKDLVDGMPDFDGVESPDLKLA